ncbi:MAG: rhomboid family intramembrane serine protease [Deltaproteobacteria bacterium]|nr:rhomboid family intramembrane serine protease [Deltaproteobacteria bacterium]
MKIRQSLFFALAAVAILWLVFFVSLIIPGDLRWYGLRPRTLGGLPGIIFSPFLHVGIFHLISNTGALFVLLAVSFSYSGRLTAVALTIIVLLGGSLTWLFGQGHAVHIGASGVVFGLTGFLAFMGIARREWRALFISLGVIAFYGGVFQSLLFVFPGQSWASHFFGLLAGIYAAWRTREFPIE